MKNDKVLELFILKCAVIQTDITNVLAEYGDPLYQTRNKIIDQRLEPYIKQFELANRQNASKMAMYYEIFYMLENDIRRLISDTLELAHGKDWWSTHVSLNVKTEAKRNQENEAKAGVSFRSDAEIDYTTFGQLGEIIRENWADFAGMLSNQSAVNRVFFSLNMLRGTIAHCGILAEDEVDRLKLAIRDWFRVLEGPKDTAV